jgi:ribose-phosphate pyrophosphokinase
MRIILSMPGNEAMAQAMADHIGCTTGRIEVRRFPDGESHVQIAGDVAGYDVDIVCTLANPDPQLAGLLFAAATVRELGARSLRLVAPYLAYMRQDARFARGEAVSAPIFARLLSGAFDALVTIDPHLHRILSLSDIYSIPASALPAAPFLAEWVRTNIEAPVLIGPDAESAQWVAAVATKAAAPWLVLDKTRHGDRDVTIKLPDMHDFTGRTPVLVDDIISSGRTMIEAAAALRTQGFGAPWCLTVHALFDAEVDASLRIVMAGIVSTDTIPHASNAISMAALLAGEHRL